MHGYGIVRSYGDAKHNAGGVTVVDDTHTWVFNPHLLHKNDHESVRSLLHVVFTDGGLVFENLNHNRNEKRRVALVPIGLEVTRCSAI